MSDFKNTVDIIGDDALTNSIIDKTITEYKDERITAVGDYAFCGCTALTTVDIPNVTTIGSKAFGNCTVLTAINLPQVINVNGLAFENCTALTTIDLVKRIGISVATFNGCTALTTLILRSDKVYSSVYNAFDTTPIKEGIGYIYVPSALIDAYKTDKAWSIYANQFRAIEDYPDICG